MTLYLIIMGVGTAVLVATPIIMSTTFTPTKARIVLAMFWSGVGLVSGGMLYGLLAVG